MSKRHQSSRRKSYGRRQHEIHERSGRRSDQEPFENVMDGDEATYASYADPRPFGFGGSVVRLGFALLD